MNYYFQHWPPSPADIKMLVEIGTSESSRLEFKRQLPEGEPLRKEVCAFANTNGGEILIGIEENNGTAAGVVPIDIKNIDNEELKILETIRTATTPPIPGVKISFVKMENGYVIAIRIPKTTIGPHMDKSKRILIRESTQSRSMEHHELRNAFLGAELHAQRLRQYRRDRCLAIFDRDTPIQMAIKRSFVTHVMPMTALGGGQRFTAIEIREAMQSAAALIDRLGGHTFHFDADGVFKMLQRRSIEAPQGTAYIHSTPSGIVECVNCISMERSLENGIVNHSMLDQDMTSAVLGSISILMELGIEAPYIVFLSLLDMNNALTNSVYDPQPVRRPHLFAHEIAVNEIPQDYKEAAKLIRPALDNLANGFGLERSPSFTEEGEWQFYRGR